MQLLRKWAVSASRLLRHHRMLGRRAQASDCGRMQALLSECCLLAALKAEESGFPRKIRSNPARALRIHTHCLG